MALEIVVTVASEIVKSTLFAAIRQVRYPFCFNNYVKDLEEENKKLLTARQSVQRRADKAKSENKKIDHGVEELLKVADGLTKEAETLEREAKGNHSCCFGHCPNIIWRYHVGKKVAEAANALKEQNKKLEPYKEFARSATLPGMNYFCSESFIFFESTENAYKQILEALNNEEISMIGLHAMGGSGKTTLVKQVGKAVERDFKKVAFAVVSATVDIWRIQGEIASFLDLPLQEKETLLERARSLWLRLTSGEKFLIILDDVWEKLDFEAIGIPFGENCKNCIVLLTTRRENVCTSMGCQRIIPLSLLGEKESWTLFQKHANGISDSLNGIAIEISKECHGLPVAIAAVASTLKGKTESEWKEALEKLREDAPVDVEEGLRNPYTCLQLSYDMLKSQEAKSLFLLCSVFPEDYEIHEEYLARYGIGLGLFEKVSSYKRARIQVSEAKNKLLESSLLLKAENDQCVKMHDLVRDVALWIAEKEKRMIVGPKSSGKVLEADETFEDNTVRYLWCDELYELPETIRRYPKLEFLYMEVSEDLILSDECFKGMKELRVLVLGNKCYGRNLTVEISIQLPTNLHCLFLNNWKLEDISFLSNLKTLEALVLRNCSFYELPNEITKFEKLRLLDLNGCEIEKNPFEVIGRCSNLEELYFVENNGSEWKEKEKETAVFLGKNKAVSVLNRYCIEIGTSSPFYKEDFSIARNLCVTNFDDFICNTTIKDLVQRAAVLGLEVSEKGWKNVIPDMLEAIGGGMNELSKFRLWESNEIECLVDTTNHLLVNAENVFSKLVKLDILSMKHFETFWRGPHEGMVNALSNLKELTLYKCPKLTSFFTCAVAQSLALLEELDIAKCRSLKHIITDDQEMKSTTSMFPNLKSVVVKECHELEYLFSVYFMQGLLKLENLRLRYAKKMKHLFGQSISNNEDPNENKFQTINLPSLKNIHLVVLPNMISVCPENYCITWPSLKLLNWKNCPNLKMMSINECNIVDSGAITQGGDTLKEEQKLGPLAMHDSQMITEAAPLQTVRNLESVYVDRGKMEGIFELSGIPKNRELQVLTSCLKDLSLRDVDALMCISRGPCRNLISLENLQTLTVYNCKKLKIVFSTCIMKNLPQLKMLEISNCDELEQIIENEKPQNITENYAADDSPMILSNSYFPQNSGSINLCNVINLFNFKKSEGSHENKDKEIAHDDDCLQSCILMFSKIEKRQD